MPKTEVEIALPIEFSEVCEVVYEDLAGTNGRSLTGVFAQAITQGGTFDATYSGSKDRLTNFRGYAAGDTTPPTIPGGFLITLNTDIDYDGDGIDNLTHTISWTASTDDVALDYYEIYKNIDGGTFSFFATTTSLNRIIDYTIVGAGIHCYKVRAVDTSGNQSSFTSEVCFTISGDITAPTIPVLTDAVQSPPSTGDIDVDWNASTDAVGVVGYLLERKVNAGSFIGIFNGNALTFLDENGTNGDTHYYRIRAYDAAGNISAYSSEISILIEII